MNRTYIAEKDEIKKRLIMMRDKLQKLYGFRYPIQRRVIEERLELPGEAVPRSSNTSSTRTTSSRGSSWT